MAEIAAVAAQRGSVSILQPRSPSTVDDAILAAPELDRLLGREPEARPLTVERDDQTVQVEELQSTDPRVRIYRLL